MNCESLEVIVCVREIYCNSASCVRREVLGLRENSASCVRRESGEVDLQLSAQGKLYKTLLVWT